MRRVAAVLCLGVLGVSAVAAPIAADPPESSAPNPLALYPRRPGAKYFDVEVEPGSTARLARLSMFAPPDVALSGFWVSLTLTRWSVVARSAVPADLVPGERSRYRAAGLLDGFSPSIPGDGDRVLRVEVRTVDDPGDIACAVTAASDGAVALPLDPQGRFRHPMPPPTDSRSQRTVEVYLPIGSYTGRFYLACRPTVFALDLQTPRAVWGIDV